MEIKKNQLVKVKHQRKGEFTAIASEDFDTEERTFYPLSLIKGNPIKISPGDPYEAGDSIPCRNSFCELELIKEGK